MHLIQLFGSMFAGIGLELLVKFAAEKLYIALWASTSVIPSHRIALQHINFSH